MFCYGPVTLTQFYAGQVLVRAFRFKLHSSHLTWNRTKINNYNKKSLHFSIRLSINISVNELLLWEGMSLSDLILRKWSPGIFNWRLWCHSTVSLPDKIRQRFHNCLSTQNLNANANKPQKFIGLVRSIKVVHTQVTYNICCVCGVKINRK